MKQKTEKNIFDTPLTKRGYLAYRAKQEVYQTYACSGGTYTLANTASILYLYGADFKGIHSFNLEDTDAENGQFLKFYEKPKIYFTLRNRPLVFKNNEVEIISTALKHSKYKVWYPYQWLTPEGDTVRTITDPLLSSSKETSEMKKWNKDFNVMKNIINAWYTDFIKKNKEPWADATGY